MFKGQSRIFSFKSYLKRQEKITSIRNGTSAENINAIELPRVNLTRIPEKNAVASEA